MIQNISRNLLSSLARLGVEPDDDDEVRLRKTLVVVSTLMIIPAGIVWGAIYLVFGEPLASLSPLAYSALSFLSIVRFARTRHYESFRLRQLSFILLLPFSLMVTLGGFANSSAVILWSLLCPLGALLVSGPREARRWFLAYLGLVLLGTLLQPFLRVTNNLPPLVVLIFFVMNVGVVSSIAYILLEFFVGQKDTFLSLLRVEQAKAESLLLNVLPKEIAAILKNEQRTIADQYEGASILFADLVGITPLTAEMEPMAMVDLLNEVFSYFDSLAEKYGVEKIRTIGDSYMVAAGVPRPRPDHAQALAGMALEMRDYCDSRALQGGKPLQFRIGINSGPVVAGVIGRRKFLYDLWGDAVNTASRMESHGTAGKIHITRDTYELIKDEFICEPRGRVLVKSKG
ncbi:MAG: adenylate/guanylate cyclase domain-containing protein, partial [Chloroflexi bacterium]|nr:adenylate/guanylate cyclase domain-containing protein [Chloroflexota bacterium]